MTDPVKEQLSTYLDGELPQGELDLLLKQVGRDAQMRAVLGRYALIRETLRAQGAVAAPADFAMRVSAAVAAEAPLQEVESKTATRPRHDSRSAPQWLRPAAGVAVAASVAALAILALQQPQEAPEAPYVEDYVADATSPTPAAVNEEPSVSYIVPTTTTVRGYMPAAARLTNYVVAHSEYSTPLGRRSVFTGVLAEEETDVSVEASSPGTVVNPSPIDNGPQR